MKLFSRETGTEARPIVRRSNLYSWDSPMKYQCDCCQRWFVESGCEVTMRTCDGPSRCDDCQRAKLDAEYRKLAGDADQQWKEYE